jgi:hypothetical protein
MGTIRWDNYQPLYYICFFLPNLTLKWLGNTFDAQGQLGDNL